jgi:hypothetical protein
MRDQRPASPSTAPAMVTVRPLRYADLDGIDAGDEGLVLYQVRNHAGEVTLDRSEITGIDSTPVHPPAAHRGDRARAGAQRSVTVRTVYGSMATVHLLDGTGASDGDPALFIENPEGTVTLPVTPDWGAQVYLSLLVPDIDPDQLAVALARILDEQFPGHRLVELRSRWAADRRVDVYRPALESAAGEGSSGAPQPPLAAGLLEAEAAAFGTAFRVEQVPGTSEPG